MVVYILQFGRYLLRRGIGGRNGFFHSFQCFFLLFLVDVIVGYLGISLGDVVVFELVFFCQLDFFQPPFERHRIESFDGVDLRHDVIATGEAGLIILFLSFF